MSARRAGPAATFPWMPCESRGTSPLRSAAELKRMASLHRPACKQSASKITRCSIAPSLSVDKERSPSDGRVGHEARVGDRLFFRPCSPLDPPRGECPAVTVAQYSTSPPDLPARVQSLPWQFSYCAKASTLQWCGLIPFLVQRITVLVVQGKQLVNGACSWVLSLSYKLQDRACTCFHRVPEGEKKEL